MEKIVVSQNKGSQIENAANKAVEILKSGGVAGLPTDTLYALSASINNEVAVKRVFAIKNRPLSKSLPILTHSKLDVCRWAKNLSTQALSLLEAFVPGPLTLVVEKSNLVPDIISALTPTVAIRVPDSNITQEIIRKLGFPITGTSANKSGGANPTSAKAVIESVGTEIDLILDAGETDNNLGSTIIDTTQNTPSILREGIITRAEIEQICKIELTTPTV